MVNSILQLPANLCDIRHTACSSDGHMRMQVEGVLEEVIFDGF